MNHRDLKIEFKDFPGTPPEMLKNNSTNDYLKEIEIDLFKLSNFYKIEEFDDCSSSVCYKEYPALRYLIPNTNLFKFQGKHPGSSKDSRKENSRVLGQTFCRYFNYYFLDAPYTSHVSNFIGKELGAEFNSVRIERNKKGDTPDFISAKNDNTIFLSEAKGRRKEIPFNHDDFNKWREQFNKISIYDSNNIQVSLKGNILELAIANENNGLYKQ